MPGRLIQTTVSEKVLRKLDALAKVQGHKRASYLRHLVETHVQALAPSIARSTMGNSPLDLVTLADEISQSKRPKKSRR